MVLKKGLPFLGRLPSAFAAANARAPLVVIRQDVAGTGFKFFVESTRDHRVEPVPAPLLCDVYEAPIDQVCMNFRHFKSPVLLIRWMDLGRDPSADGRSGGDIGATRPVVLVAALF